MLNEPRAGAAPHAPHLKRRLTRRLNLRNCPCSQLRGGRGVEEQALLSRNNPDREGCPCSVDGWSWRYRGKLGIGIRMSDKAHLQAPLIEGGLGEVVSLVELTAF